MMNQETGGYVLFPKTKVENTSEAVSQGFAEISSRLSQACAGQSKVVLTVECYPGVDQQELLEGLQSLHRQKSSTATTWPLSRRRLTTCWKRI